MKKLLVIFAVLAISIPSIALAAVFKTDTNVPAGEVVVGNLYLAGSNPSVGGDVNGDLYIAGGNIVISGNVTEDVVAAGGNITITGEVGGDVRSFGGSVFIDSNVNGEVIASGGDVRIGPNAVIRKDLVAAGGDVSVDKTAKVYGSRTIESGEGKGRNFDKQIDPMMKFLTGAFWIGQIFLLLSYFVIVAILMGLFPNLVKKFSVRALSKGQFWKSLGLGLLALIVTPIVAGICFVTGIGALLGVIVMLCYICYILVSIVLAGVLFGDVVRKLLFKPKKVEPSWGWALGGIALLQAFTLIPVVGWLLGFVFFLYSMGTVLVVEWKIARVVK